MRPSHLVVLLCLMFVGCSAPPPAIPDAEPGTAAERSEARELTAGDIGLTPTLAQQAFEVVVPAEATRIVVQLSIAEGAAVDFRLTGLPGCELEVPGPAHLSGMRRSPECRVPAGTYTLTVSQATGHVTGDLRVLGRAG